MKASWAARRVARRTQKASEKTGHREQVKELMAIFPKKIEPWRHGVRMREDDAGKVKFAGELMRGLEAVRGRHRQVGVGAYNVLLMYFATAGLRNFFKSTWGQMVADGVEPDLVSFNQKLLDTATRNANDISKEASQVWRDMKQASIEPNQLSRRLLTKALVTDGKFEAALHLLTTQGGKETRPVMVLLSGAPDLHKAEMVLERFGLGRKEEKVVQSLLSVCRRSGDVASAEKFFAGIPKPHETTVIYLLLVYADTGLLEKFIALMKKYAVCFTTSVCANLIRCASRHPTPHHLSLALPYYRLAQSMGIAGNIRIHTDMLLLAGSDTTLASEIHQDLISNHLKETDRYREVLVSVFTKAGKVGEVPPKRGLRAPMPVPCIETRI